MLFRSVLERVAVDALVYESGDRRVAFLAGGIVRGGPGRAWVEASPPITVDDDVLVVGAPRLGDEVGSTGGSGGVTATIETDVSHDRRPLGDGEFAIALETSTPSVGPRVRG